MLALRTGEKKAMVGAMIGRLTCVVIKIWMVVSPKIKMKIKIRKKKNLHGKDPDGGESMQS